MATISNQKLAIQENLPNGNVRATVTCKVSFTTLERNLMGLGLRFRLSCKLWSDDPSIWLIDNGDDVLYSFSPSKTYPDANPAAVENVTFTALLKSSKLNEDSGVFDNEDEVYAKITLRNLETGTEVSKNTNTIKHHF